MTKVVTPLGILVTIALLAIFCALAILIGSIEDSWPLRLGGLLALVAAVGAAMLQPWSRFLVYAVTAGFTLKLGASVFTGVTSGYFDFQFSSARQAVGSLLPSTAMLLLSLVCCYMMHNHFRPGIGTPQKSNTLLPRTRRTAEQATPHGGLHRQLPNEIPWLILAAAAVLVGQSLQANVHLNHDVSWIGHSARWLLEGRSFGTGILDVNPPLPWLLSLPAAMVANAGWLPEPQSLQLTFWTYVILAFVLTLHILAGSPSGQRTAAAGWNVGYLVAATLMAGASFGQREYLSVLFAMPYLATATVRLSGGSLPRTATLIATGMIAGLGFAIKPHFLAVPALVEILVVARLGWRTLFRAENLVASAVILCYVLGVAVFAVDYFRISLPMARTAYWAFDSGSFAVVFQRFVAATEPAAIGLLIALVSRSWTNIHSIVLLATLGYSASYFAQAKGFVYHAYPVLAFSSMFLSVSLTTGVAAIARGRFLRSQIANGALSACLIALAIPTIKALHDDVVQWYFTYHIELGPIGRYRQSVINAVNHYAPKGNSSYFAFSTHPFPAFPTGSYTLAEWAGRSPTQGVVAALARIDEVHDSKLRLEILQASAKQLDMVVEDLTRRPPSLIFVESAPARLGLGTKPFDDLAFYLRDPRFRKIWTSYVEAERVGSLRVFVSRATTH